MNFSFTTAHDAQLYPIFAVHTLYVNMKLDYQYFADMKHDFVGR
jgi:hypothetical protein